MSEDIRRTLLFPHKDDKILLAMKKRGFGAGRWNGLGGRPEQGETLHQAAIRESQEEAGITPTNFTYVAELNFKWPQKTDNNEFQVHTYLCDQWEGKPTETEEMAPRWFKKSEIPYEDMWSDDEHWLPLVLGGKVLRAFFEFDDNDKVISKKIEEAILE